MDSYDSCVASVINLAVQISAEMKEDIEHLTESACDTSTQKVIGSKSMCIGVLILQVHSCNSFHKDTIYKNKCFNDKLNEFKL